MARIHPGPLVQLHIEKGGGMERIMRDVLVKLISTLLGVGAGYFANDLTHNMWTTVSAAALVGATLGSFGKIFENWLDGYYNKPPM